MCERTAMLSGRIVAFVAFVAALGSLAGCGSPACVSRGDAAAIPDGDPLNAAPQCTSGATWTCGNAESNVMNPGQACVTCHQRMRGPAWQFAGTVYATGHEPDNCVGHASTASSTVEVIITDSAGRELVTTTNPGGNFIIFENVATPYRARVRYQGRERAMASQQSDGDCNSCHTQSGSRGARGRIVLP